MGEEEVGYLELLAGIVAVALKNAQLYRERGRLSLALAAERGRLVRILEELPDGVVVLLGEEGFANRRAGRSWAWGNGWSSPTCPPSWGRPWKGDGWKSFSKG